MRAVGQQGLFRHRRGGGPHRRASRRAAIANRCSPISMTAARIVDLCDHIHFFQRPLTARDMLTGHDLDINTAYACMAGTSKHVGTSMVAPEHVDRSASQMLHYVAGSEDEVARAALRVAVELLRRAADEIRRRRLPLPRNGGARRHAGAAALGRHRPAPPRRPRLPAPSCRRSPNASPASSM